MSGRLDVSDVGFGAGRVEPVRKDEHPALAGWTRLNPEWWDEQPPPQPYLLTVRRGGRAVGVLPAGETALLVGSGSVGKSFLLTQLAASVAAGLPWLGTFDVARPGPVVLVLAEDREVVLRRRLQALRRSLSPEGARALKRAHLVVVEVRGHDIALTERDCSDTPFAMALRSRLQDEGVDWSAIILDPLARFAGADAEKDNAAATRFVEALERLTEVRGNPTVVVAHHTNQLSRAGATDATAARGVTGLSDGVRWQANLDAVSKASSAGHGRSLVRFQVTKSNYAPGLADGLVLARDPNSGLLMSATEEELAALRATEQAAGKSPQRDKQRRKRRTSPKKGPPTGNPYEEDA